MSRVLRSIRKLLPPFADREARRRDPSDAVAPSPAQASHWALVNSLFERIQASRPGLRANYTWSTLHAAAIVSRTGGNRLSVIEFGVAGGSGLVAMESAAEAAEKALDVEIDVYGFDTGSGLPRPRDLRDAPFLMEQGDFPMDEERLQARLERARLILGDVNETVRPFLDSRPAPIGFVSFDLDYYSSTRDALAVLLGDPRSLMPRILCYFDDTHGYPWGEFNGARLAIADFNSAHDDRKVAQLHGLKHLLPRSEFDLRWPDAMYLAHLFDHPAYTDYEGTELVKRLDLPESVGADDVRRA